MGTDIYLYVEKRNESGEWVPVLDLTWDIRNYRLFAMLAGIRNEFNIEPIADPRGIPDDASEYVKTLAIEDASICYGYSYLTLAELLAYDWDRIVTLTGVVDEENYKIFKETGQPRQFSSGVGGLLVRVVSNEAMDAIISGQKEREKWNGHDVYYYTEITWNISYREAAGKFYTEFLPKLQQLAGDDPESVRIVFWFD